MADMEMLLALAARVEAAGEDGWNWGNPDPADGPCCAKGRLQEEMLGRGMALFNADPPGTYLGIAEAAEALGLTRGQAWHLLLGQPRDMPEMLEELRRLAAGGKPSEDGY